MTDPTRRKPIPGPRAARRGRGGVAAIALVDIAPLHSDRRLPVLIRPAVPGVHLAEWASVHRNILEEHLLREGAVLLRGFSVREAAQFETLVATLYPRLVTEHERSSPRHQVSGSVY